MKTSRRDEGSCPLLASALAGTARLPGRLHSRRPAWEGELWREEERKERLVWGKRRTKDGWVAGVWWLFFFYLEFLCKGRKYQLSRKPSTH